MFFIGRVRNELPLVGGGVSSRRRFAVNLVDGGACLITWLVLHVGSFYWLLFVNEQGEGTNQNPIAHQ
jgi:hypothetical protein